MNLIYDNKLNDISELNLLHDILIPSERTKSINNYYCPILHGCKGKAGFKNFEYYWILDVVTWL